MITGQHRERVRIGTVGEPILGVEHRISEQGELQLRGGMVFSGYYKNAEATAASIIDGWLHTGDVVKEENGQLRIVDRLKDIMITAGGKNLTPSEIENTMKASPYIKECIIVAEAASMSPPSFRSITRWSANGRGTAFGLHPLSLAGR